MSWMEIKVGDVLVARLEGNHIDLIRVLETMLDGTVVGEIVQCSKSAAEGYRALYPSDLLIALDDLSPLERVIYGVDDV